MLSCYNFDQGVDVHYAQTDTVFLQIMDSVDWCDCAVWSSVRVLCFES